MLDLTQDKALIFRIVHVANLPALIDNGIICRRSATKAYKNIGNEELIERRNSRPVPIDPGGTLSDYVPFYFTPKSIMLYNIYTGWGGIKKQDNKDIVFIVSSLNRIQEMNAKYVYTDRHAVLATARFYTGLNHLDQVSWDILRRVDFKQDYNNPIKKEHYQAEALIHKAVPFQAILGIACLNDSVVSNVGKLFVSAKLDLKTTSRPAWYFQ